MTTNAERHSRLSGLFPALTTPFVDGEISTDRLWDNLARYEALALEGYLVLGSTGESVLLDEDERARLIRAARSTIAPDKALVAGVSGESTRAARRQSHDAWVSGADYVLVSTPHYFREQMTRETLREHFRVVADDSPLPLLLYNVPKFTGFSLPAEIVIELSRHENVVGIKDSSGDLDQLDRVVAGAVDGFRVLCGDAQVLGESLRRGASGAILASAVVFPEPLVRIVGEARRGDGAVPLPASWDDARTIVSRHGVPALKAAMDLRGLFGGSPRGPLRPVDREVAGQIEEVLDRLLEDDLIPDRSL